VLHPEQIAQTTMRLARNLSKCEGKEVMKVILSLWIQPNYNIDPEYLLPIQRLTSYERDVPTETNIFAARERREPEAVRKTLCKTLTQLDLALYVSDQKNSRSEIGRRSQTL
jgi:hypothetical protein